MEIELRGQRINAELIMSIINKIIIQSQPRKKFLFQSQSVLEKIITRSEVRQDRTKIS